MDSPCHQQLHSDGAPPSPEELRTMIEDKARELFAVCDLEEKGFVNKLDMRRLVGELPGLDEIQLEYVFDSLDDDGNGFLTLEEFTQGFGGFLGINSATEEPPPSPGLYEVQKKDEVTDTLEQDFRQAMDSLGANEVFTEQEQIQALWTKLREENPDLLGNFEEVLRKVSNDVKSATHTKGELEQVLKSRSTIHEEQVSKLYQEMEQQIQGEKDKLIAQEKEREKRDREEMDLEMKRKEELLHELLKKQSELERKLTELSSTEKQTKEEKERLEEDNNKLHGQLSYTEQDLQQTKSYLTKLQERIKEEKRARADASLRVTRGIAEERASLCKQLSLLKDMNKKLVDERDAIKLEKEVDERLSERNPMIKQGSVMSDYFEPSEEEHPDSDVNDNRLIEEEEVEYDFAYEHSTGSLPTHDGSHTPPGYVGGGGHLVNGGGTYNGYGGHTNGHLNGGTNGHMNGHLGGDGNSSDEADSDLRALRGGRVRRINSPPLSEELAHSLHQELQATQDSALYSTAESGGGLHQWSTSAPRIHSAEALGSDLGMETVLADEVLRGPGEGEESPLEVDGTGPRRKTQTSESGTETTSEEHPHLRDPQRLYKVVFVGDSYVGKTSLLHRICNGTFLEAFNATIGVDFQVKTMSVNDHSVAIQLWDTAGQERYRSITRHYFRKADAVVVVYDITSEKSFLSVRNWMSNIEEVTDEHVVKVLVGNKVDVADDRQVETDAGKAFAEAYQCMFYEASALDGTNVSQCLEEMAQRLLEKEDREMEEALKLINEVVADKKKCCKS